LLLCNTLPCCIENKN